MHKELSHVCWPVSYRRRLSLVGKGAFFGLFCVLILSGCVSVESVQEVQKPEPVAGWQTANENQTPQIVRELPPVEREFRAAWVATVDNIDWPSKPGLSTTAQQSEMRTLLDRAKLLNLNAIVFQIRPTADALYASDLEPWSYYLTGKNGEAPEPFYDPLAFTVEEAHKRGLELHVWFNPYRAYHPTAPDSLSSGHIKNMLPEAVHQYGAQRWMDPGSPQATDHSLAVIMDVVNRYDIDGVHMDDYFYPYPVNDEDGNRVEFPDSAFYAIYGTGLSLADWRRRNVDDLILRVYSNIKAAKPWVLFGISPFGIWRPGYPEMVTGFDAYENLYADAKKWLREGWVDYFTPQLYWSLTSKGQPYGPLLDWWIGENVKQRHMWPGLFTSRVILEDASHWEPFEIIDQVDHTRNTPGASGNVHFSMKALARLDSPLANQLAANQYEKKAIPPASYWLEGGAPARPRASVERLGDDTYLAMAPGDHVSIRNWVVWINEHEKWVQLIIPAWSHTLKLNNYPDAKIIVLQGFTRLGKESAPHVLLFNN